MEEKHETLVQEPEPSPDFHETVQRARNLLARMAKRQAAQKPAAKPNRKARRKLKSLKRKAVRQQQGKNRR